MSPEAESACSNAEVAHWDSDSHLALTFQCQQTKSRRWHGAITLSILIVTGYACVLGNTLIDWGWN